MNFRILINMVCIAALFMGVYLVKYSVQDVQRDVVALRSELAVEKESLHLLNAEWAYLNRPDRLRHLADRHLDLVPLDSRQIEQIAVLPAAVIVTEDDDQRAMIHPVSQTRGNQ
ncbi:MAG: cell division protein FtsL [Pseudomonadota bacterium]